ncbi:MAG TPA: DUF58 domain-containing protein [Planctomycetaceae bacterium]|nr:DUF58 domain-containing protein [Planctomycetaceae bacterium]
MAATTGASRASALDPSALMQIKSLSLRAKSVVEGFLTGLHRSPLRGFSVEFAEYRPYCEGDDPRTVDWKLLARTDRYYVKQFEDETNRRCYIALDQSRSMSYSSGEYSKADYARTLAATFGYFLRMQRDAIGLITTAAQHSTYLPPRTSNSHLQQIFGVLQRESAASESDFAGTLTQLAGLSKRRGIILMITDGLFNPETLLKPLGYLRGRSHELIMVRVLDRREVKFELPESSLLEDLETGERLFLNPDDAKRTYQQRFSQHEKELLEVCHQRKVRLLTVVTDQPPSSALLELVCGVGSQTVQGSHWAQDSKTPVGPSSRGGGR